MKKNMLGMAIGIAALLVAFQNCARTSFGNGSGGDLSTKSSQTLIPIADGDNNDLAAGDDITDTNGDSGSEVSDDSHSTNHPAMNDHGRDSETPVSQDQDMPQEADDADGSYVACILSQHGKSLKLGLLTEKLGGVESVAESVCVTRKECLGDIAKAFAVEGAYERGYCEHNPNVKRLTDAEVKALLQP